MPDFRIIVTDTSDISFPLRVWDDPPSVDGDRPRRITTQGDRVQRMIVVPPNTSVRFKAIMDGEASPEADSVVGLFTAWAVEYGSLGPPRPVIVTPGTSAVVDWKLVDVGHYALAMRHEYIAGVPKARNGGYVLVHLDVMDT